MIYDISVPLNGEMHIFPGNPPFKRTLNSSQAKGSLCTNSTIEMGVHTGTHVDAPFHMISEGCGISELPNDSWVGPARVIEVSNSETVTMTELHSHSLDGVERLLFKTRNSSLWSRRSFQASFVYIEPEAAHYLAGLGLKLIGLDYLSIEQFESGDCRSHLELMKQGIVILEGITLTHVPRGDYILFCCPLKIEGSDGAPARAFLIDKSSVARWV